MLKRFWRPETGVFLALWVTFMITGRSGFFADPGTFWHTVVGERMISSGELIRTDPFSFTKGGEPWVASQWLAECVMALLYRAAGFDGLHLAAVTLLAGLYTWVAHRLIRAGFHWSLAVTCVALTVGISYYHFLIRPHILTIALLGWTFARLCDYEAGRISFRSLWWLVPVFVLWTNVHGGMLAGLGTLGLTVAGWFLAKPLRLPTPITSYRQIIPFALLIMACGLTAFVNPYGPELPRVWHTVMKAELPQYIAEHAPLDPTDPVGLLIISLGIIYAAALLGILPRWPRVTWLIPLVWFYLACTRIRHGPLFTMTAIVALADVFPQTLYARWIIRRGSDLFVPPAATAPPVRGFDFRPALLPALVVLLAFGLKAGSRPVPVMGSDWAQLDPGYWPIELLPKLEQYEKAGQSRIFNDDLYGGFLIFHRPGLKVFIDDRCELYGDQFMLDYIHVAERADRDQLDRWADQHGFNLVITTKNSGFDKCLRDSKGWSKVGETTPEELTQFALTIRQLQRSLKGQGGEEEPKQIILYERVAPTKKAE